MNIISTILSHITPWHPFIWWQDIVEISIFIFFFHCITAWLSRNKSTRLTVYFYSYYALWYGAHYYHAHSLFLVLSLAFPAALLICILLHQDLLQRNIIAYKSRPVILTSSVWLETIIQLSLIAQNRKQKVTWLIEHTDQLNEFLDISFSCQAPAHAELLHTILESKRYKESAMIWINAHGTLLGANAEWKNPNNTSCDMIDASILYTHKLDALVCIFDPQSPQYTVIAHGSIIHCSTIQQVLLTIKKHIHVSSSSSGERHAILTQKDSFKQRTP